MVSCSTEHRAVPARRGTGARAPWLASVLLALSASDPLRATPGDAERAATQPGDLPCHEVPLCYVASHAESEPNRLVLYDLDLVDTTRGISRIKADRAEGTGRDIGSSGWVLTGHVQVFIPEGELHADRATVQFANKRIDSVTAEGAPAEFQHMLENGQMAHGHAEAIHFNMVRNELQFDGDSWFTDGCNDITSNHIFYDIASQHVRAESDPGSGTRVHGTIRSTSGVTQCGRQP